VKENRGSNIDAGGGLAKGARGAGSASGECGTAGSKREFRVGRRLAKENLGTIITEGGGPIDGDATWGTSRGRGGAEGSHAASTRNVGGLVRATIGNFADGAGTVSHYN